MTLLMEACLWFVMGSPRPIVLLQSVINRLGLGMVDNPFFW